VLSAVTAFSACLRRLFGMWRNVVYVCACLMYLSVECLVVKSQLYIYIYDIRSLRVNTSAHCGGRKQVKG